MRELFNQRIRNRKIDDQGKGSIWNSGRIKDPCAMSALVWPWVITDYFLNMKGQVQALWLVSTESHGRTFVRVDTGII